MQDLYLKFSDEQQAQDVLYTKVVTKWEEEPVLDTEGNEVEPLPLEWRYEPKYRNIDVIGTIYEGETEFDTEGNVVSEPVALEGHHVNIRLVSGEDASDLELFKVQPSSPVRVWA